jgi:hypothetical protein
LPNLSEIFPTMQFIANFLRERIEVVINRVADNHFIKNKLF